LDFDKIHSVADSVAVACNRHNCHRHFRAYHVHPAYTHHTETAETAETAPVETAPAAVEAAETVEEAAVETAVAADSSLPCTDLALAFALAFAPALFCLGVRNLSSELVAFVTC